MVHKVFHIMYREVRGLHQAAYIIAFFTFGSQMLALVRDRILAHQFGVGIELDLYYAAFRIPDFLYVLFASTLSIYVLIPFISKKLEHSNQAAQVFLSQFFSLFIYIYGACAILAMIYAPQLIGFLFPGFFDQSETLVLITRILLVQPLLLGVSSLYGVITQIEHRFILYAISPLFYNLGIICGAVFLYPSFGISGLALGVLVGAFGHLCIQIPFVWKSNLAPKFILSSTQFSGSDIRAVFRVSLIRAITLSMHQVVLLCLIGFASMMTVGSVSVFQFAYNLQSVPLTIIGVSYSVAAFPMLVRLYTEKKFKELGMHMTTALRHIFFWSLPAVALFIVIRAQFVRVVLGSGSFDWNDTRLTAAVLALFILSLVAQAIHLLVVRALYAVGNTRLPFFVTLITSILALTFSFYLYLFLLSSPTFYAFVQSTMRLDGVSGIEVLALPFGYSCALIIHSFLILILARSYIFLSIKTLARPFIQAVVASLFCGYGSYVTLNIIALYIETDTFLSVCLQGSVAAGVGFLLYILLQYIFKNTELFEMYKTLSKRINENPLIVPQDEDKFSI